MLSRIKQGIRRFLSNSQSNSLSGSNQRSEFVVSFVVIVYDMPTQAQNTVRSLLADYQLDARPEDYEVLIVENASANTMSQAFLDSLPPTFSYHLRQETQPTPIHAINYGIERARGDNICVMIDGARLLTPGVVKNIIRGHHLSPRAIVTAPGYHLGYELQQKAVGSGYDVAQEQALMDSIAWPADGYRLFEIACFSGSCAAGFYLPHGESNCISMPRDLWKALGGYDARFDMRGGGVVNLDLYKRACEYPGITHVFLHGEGTFHQFHGGVTTGGEEAEVRQKFIVAIMEQYQSIRGRKFENPLTNTVYLGELPDQAQKFVQMSSSKKIERMNNTTTAQRVSG
jgi:glycosyltransferase involved in cell wall biosynthesis